MGKKYKNLFEQIVARDNLYDAYHKASRGKRYSAGHLLFQEHLAANLANLGQQMRSGEYTPGEPRKFYVHEPKLRQITAMPFIDRVAQHALCNVLEPIFEKTFLPQSHACRKGRGTHSAARQVQAELRRLEATGATPWVLKTDFSRYFASISLDILNAEYRRKIACTPTMDLLEKLVPATGRGLPIGNLTSQLSANIYGHIVDRWLVHKMGILRFFRYMDDIVIIGHSREAMALLHAMLHQFVRTEMEMRFSKWSIQPASRGINFVGYRIWASYKLIRRDSVIRAKRKIKRYTASGEEKRLSMFIAAWKGHVQHADRFNLLNHLGVST